MKVNKKKVIKGCKIGGSVIFYAIIVVLLLFSIANINRDNKNNDYPKLFGRGFLIVVSDSMSCNESIGMTEQKDNFNKGDMILVKKPNQKAIDNLKVGDIITFEDANLKAQGYDSWLNTHRIVYIYESSDSRVFITQGDYNAAVYGDYIKPIFDSNGTITNQSEFMQNEHIKNSAGAYNFETKTEEEVLGIYTGKVSGFGNTLQVVNNNFFWFIVMPVLIFFLVEVFLVIRNFVGLSNEKNKIALDTQKDQMKADLEAQKEAIRLEIMAQLQKETEAQTATPVNDKINEEEPTEVLETTVEEKEENIE